MASVLLATERFSEKARDLLKSGLALEPAFAVRKGLLAGGKEDVGEVKLEELGRASDIGGMMLYTSGTTNRPVSFFFFFLSLCLNWADSRRKESSFPTRH